MNMNKSIKYLFVGMIALVCLFAFADHADAKNKVHFTGMPCGNVYVNGVHYGGGQYLCIFLHEQDQCPQPPRPTCTPHKFCQGGNVWQQNAACSTSEYQVCLTGCTSGVCNAVKSSGSCINGAPCTSAPNACGMTNGTKSCASNICVPPSNSLCKNASCTGPDGAIIQSGETRLYYASATSCFNSKAVTCKDGVLSGSDKSHKFSTCTDGTGDLPVISAFRMSPDTVNKGGACTMVWEVDKAANCTLTGPNIPAAGWNAKLPAGSIKTPTITSSSIYKLTCTNTKGSVNKDAICRLNANVQEQ